MVVRVSDVDAEEADLVIDEAYSFPMITHFAIEPHAFAAAPVEDGIDIWSTIQHPYLLQKLMAKLLDMPLAKVRVYAPDPGGGFGGKQNIKLEPLVALMALETGRPVRLVLTLDESFQANRRVSAEVRVDRRRERVRRIDVEPDERAVDTALDPPLLPLLECQLGRLRPLVLRDLRSDRWSAGRGQRGVLRGHGLWQVPGRSLHISGRWMHPPG